MNWAELTERLSHIPENRRQEPAVFADEDGYTVTIDDLCYNDPTIDEHPTSWEDLADNSIYPEGDEPDVNPITLTP